MSQPALLPTKTLAGLARGKIASTTKSIVTGANIHKTGGIKQNFSIPIQASRIVEGSGSALTKLELLASSTFQLNPILDSAMMASQSHFGLEI